MQRDTARALDTIALVAAGEATQRRAVYDGALHRGDFVFKRHVHGDFPSLISL
jgi:hypothetical protein